MPKERQLEDGEVSLIRAMIAKDLYNFQDIAFMFSRVGRTVSTGRITEINQNKECYNGIEAASDEALEKFLDDWKEIQFPKAPDVNPGPVHPKTLNDIFPARRGKIIRLNISETQIVEGKESFDWASKAKYCKTLAGMANNAGGYILFGVKDGSFEVSGIAQDRMERFDLKKANEFIVRTFNQTLNLEKGQFEVDGKTIGAIYVHPSSNKPVVCKMDGGNLFSGDIYYRYSGETRRVQAPELDHLLKVRDSSAEDRVLQLMLKLSEKGIKNTAIINLDSGEVEGDRGKFIIEESLLEKVKFISQGKFVEKDGAPALRVVGDVQPVGASNISIQQSVVGSITEGHIHEAFLYQKCRYDPTVYIRAQTHLQPVWLPIYYFANMANLDKNGLITCLNESESPYKTRIAKQIERIKKGAPPVGYPAQTTVSTYVEKLSGAKPLTIDDEHHAKKYLQAIRLLTPNKIELDRLLSIIIDLRARFGNSQALRSDFRYTIAAVDVLWFSHMIK